MIRQLKLSARAERGTVAEFLFCAALVTVFLPVKVYPVVFLVASLLFFWDTPRLLRGVWVWCLLVFVGYATIVFLAGLPANARELAQYAKIPVNLGFFYCATGWMAGRDNARLLRLVDISLTLVLGITLLQLMVYHAASDFRWIGGAPSSAHGSALYQADRYFWGLDDKNMYGARIALLGFAFVLLPLTRQRRVVWWRLLLVFALAWLSLSRTPMVALFIGVFSLLWWRSSARWRIVLALAALAVVPMMADKVVRISSILASNDGMGVRLTYWKAFFEHFTAISPWGNGFMAAGTFLSRYAIFYHGEPNIHNTFFNCYLDFGIIGFGSYSAFLYALYRFGWTTAGGAAFWTVALLPLLAILMILYSGYDNDILLYLALVFLVGNVYTAAGHWQKGGQAG